MTKPALTTALAAVDNILYRDDGRIGKEEVFIKFGSGTMPSGTGSVIIADAAVKTNSKLAVSATSTHDGRLYVDTIIDGTSFVVNSTAANQENAAVTFTYIINN